MPFKLVALDLDGTLLNRQHRLSERSRVALQRLQAQGVRIVLASGRMHCSSVPFAAALHLQEPLISYNGALIKWEPTGEVLHHLPVPPEAAAEVVAFATDRGLHLNLYLDDVWYVSANTRWTRLYAERTGVTPVIRPDLPEWAAGREPTKVILIDEPAVISSLLSEWRGRTKGRLYVTTSEPEYLEFMHPQVSKGWALRRVREYFGLAREETAAFGDNPNDVPLLEEAGLGVAVANAHPETKAVADLVTASNDEDGVAQVIEGWLREGE